MNVYDFDGTIYNGDSTIDFYKFVLKRKPSIIKYLPKQIMGFILYAIRIIDKTQLKEWFFSFLKSIDTDTMVDKFWDIHKDKIFQWYIVQHRENDVVISASPDFLLRKICSLIGVKHLIATKVNPGDGKMLSLNCSGNEKVMRFEEHFDLKSVDSFYSDSDRDIPMAKAARKAYKVKNGKVAIWNI